MNTGLFADFIQNHDLLVIATFGKEFPESAVVEYASSGTTIIFDTDRASRKFLNITKNPCVSVVIGWDNENEEETLQYHGICTELSGKELEALKRVYFAKNPTAQKWEYEPGTVYCKIEPTWIRHTDLKVYPWIITEHTF